MWDFMRDIVRDILTRKYPDVQPLLKSVGLWDISPTYTQEI